MKHDATTETMLYYSRRDLKWVLDHMSNDHKLRNKVIKLIKKQEDLIKEIVSDPNFVPHTCVTCLNCQVKYNKCRKYEVDDKDICINWEWEGSFIYG